MKLAFNAVLVALIVLLMAFAMVSCAAYPGPSRINLTADPYLGTTGGFYSMNLTASVSDASGNPVVDGTVVDFTIDVPGGSFSGIPTNYTSRYYPVRNGNLNGNNSQFASVPTSGGKAVAHYGWFPDNKIPTGYVMITASPNNTPGVKSTYYLEFNGTTQVMWTLAPVVCPIPPSTPTQTPAAAQSPTSTPLSPMVTLLSLTIGAAILSAVRRK